MYISREKKILTILTCLSLLLSIIPTNWGIQVSADTLVSFEHEEYLSSEKLRSFDDYDYSAEIVTLTQWSGHSNKEFIFKNTGTETIHDWRFTFDFNANIENPYNCYIIEHEGNLYTIGNADWNQDIYPGESITIGFTAASNDNSGIIEDPTFFFLNTKSELISNTDLSLSFQEYSNWTTGFSGAIILTNDSQQEIRDWTISFRSNRPITQVNAGSLVSSSDSDNFYTITNDGNNQNINVGQAYRLEILGGENNPVVPMEFTDCNITVKALALGLSEDNNDNEIADVLEFDKGNIVPVTPKPTVTNTPICTPTAIPTESNTPTPTNVPISTPTSFPVPTTTTTPAATSTPTGIVFPTTSATPTGKPSDIPTDTPPASITPSVEANLDVTVDKRVLPCDSGVVEVYLNVNVLTTAGIDKIIVEDKTSNDSFEMEKSDSEKNNYNATLFIDTNIGIDTKEEKMFEIKCFLGDNQTVSQSFQITIASASIESYYNSVYVNEYLFDYIERGSYLQDDYESRKTKCLSILSDLESIGVIESDSIFANIENCTISYRPSGDIIHFVEYKDYDSEVASTSFRSPNLLRSPLGNDLQIESNYDILFIYGFADNENHREADYSAVVTYFSGEVGDTRFTNEFGAKNTYIQYEPTLKDYAEGMNNSKITILASHGVIIDKSYSSSICTNILVDIKKSDDKSYYESIKTEYPGCLAANEINDGVFEICLLPEFFRKAYGSNGLNNTAVILDNCYSAYGHNSSTYDSVLDAIVSCGAEAVTGSNTLLYNYYNADFCRGYIYHIYEGKTFKESFDNAFKIDNGLATDNIADGHIIDGCNIYGTFFDLSNEEPSPTPTSTPTPIPESHDPIDVWFICESSDNFGTEKINAYEYTMRYLFEQGIYSAGNDHFGVGYSTTHGTASSTYDQPGDFMYENAINYVRSQYTYGQGLLGTEITIPIDWYLCVYWSDLNDSISESEKNYNNRPSYFKGSNYVFFVDSETNGYLNSLYTDEALYCARKNNVKVFFVNMGSTPLRSDLVSFAKATGGAVLSSSPQAMWEELKSYQV